MDMSDWPERMAKVTSLQLDPRNPRLPKSAQPRTQKELIAELVQHERVYELARRISRRGWYRIESLIGMDLEDGQTAVLEGNRRLAALKLLLSPSIAPDADVKRFRKLSKKIDHAKIRKVRVIIAPDREEAMVVIRDKHTRQQIARWTRIMQANFHVTLLEDGLTPEDLAERHGIPPGEVMDFVRRSNLYAVAVANAEALPENVRQVVRDPRNFPSSTLDRLFDNTHTLEVLGASFDKKGGLKGTIAPAEFNKGFRRLLTDIVSRKFNTRDHSTAKQINAYLDALGNDKPDLTKSGSFTTKTLLQGTASASQGPAAPPESPAVKPPPKPPGYGLSSPVVPRRTKCTLEAMRIHDVLRELKKLKPGDHANAVAMNLRLLVELATAHHFYATKKVTILYQRMTPEKQKSGYSPNLRDMLRYVQKEDTLVEGNAKTALSKLLTGPFTPHNLDLMNAFAHNQYNSPTPGELHAIWSVLSPLMEVLLAEPTAQHKADALKQIADNKAKMAAQQVAATTAPAPATAAAKPTSKKKP